MEELKELIKGMVENRGFPVRIDTKICEKHKEAHNNCIGCIGHDGCDKYVQIMTLQAMSIFQKTDSLEQQVKNIEYLQKKTNEILEVKPKEEKDEQ